MEFKEERMPTNGISLPKASSLDLMGRQSVRATFKLSPKAIEILSIAAVQLGIKQKSLFDHLMEDGKTLGLIARKVETQQFDALERIQKTFVISRRSLKSLEDTAKQFNTCRDALVEFSIQRLVPILQREREKHEKRKMILGDLNHFFDQGILLLEKCQANLGKNDLFTTKFKSAIDALKDARAKIHSLVKKGQMIEGFNIQHSVLNLTHPGEDD